MKGILITNGALFVACGRMTYRSREGTWEVSPVSYDSLAWELRTEPPERYTMLTDRDIRALDGETLTGLFDIHGKTCATLGLDAEEALTPDAEGENDCEADDIQYPTLSELFETDD